MLRPAKALRQESLTALHRRYYIENISKEINKLNDLPANNLLIMFHF